MLTLPHCVLLPLHWHVTPPQMCDSLLCNRCGQTSHLRITSFHARSAAATPSPAAFLAEVRKVRLFLIHVTGSFVFLQNMRVLFKLIWSTCLLFLWTCNDLTIKSNLGTLTSCQFTKPALDWFSIEWFVVLPTSFAFLSPPDVLLVLPNTDQKSLLFPQNRFTNHPTIFTSTCTSGNPVACEHWVSGWLDQGTLSGTGAVRILRNRHSCNVKLGRGKNVPCHLFCFSSEHAHSPNVSCIWHTWKIRIVCPRPARHFQCSASPEFWLNHLIPNWTHIHPHTAKPFCLVLIKRCNSAR